MKTLILKEYPFIWIINIVSGNLKMLKNLQYDNLFIDQLTTKMPQANYKLARLQRREQMKFFHNCLVRRKSYGVRIKTQLVSYHTQKGIGFTYNNVSSGSLIVFVYRFTR